MAEQQSPTILDDSSSYLIGNNVMTLGKMSPGNNVYMEEMLLKL